MYPVNRTRRLQVESPTNCVSMPTLSSYEIHIYIYGTYIIIESIGSHLMPMKMLTESHYLQLIYDPLKQ